ncbi:penicillin-binding protein 2 [Candidatus Uhrbacteria bacterium]|nr:penicillin-binding protein 2 [Candidatus Uhrbacteria bacterium]
MSRASVPFVPDFGSTIELHRTVRHEWVESVVPGQESDQSRQFLGTSISRRTISLTYGLIICTLAVFAFRSAYLQLFEGRGFAMIAESQKDKVEIKPARRGIIFDRNGAVLVNNTPRFVLEVLPAQMARNHDEREKSIKQASALVGMSAEELGGLIANHHFLEPLVVADNLAYPDALRVMVEAENIPGVAVVPTFSRGYQFGGASSLAHVVGTMGRISEQEYTKAAGIYRLSDIIGKSGLEFYYESQLRGRDGRRVIEVDALGREKRILSEDRPQDGTSLTLSIDRELQAKSEEALRAWMETIGSSGGVVIISDPKTGAVRTLVSLPAFDSAILAKGISATAYADLIRDPSRPLFNRALQGEYPSGSTIKPLVAAAALQGGIITPLTSFMSTGGIRISQWFFPDWKSGGHGRTNVTKALAESVNTFFYIVGGGYESVPGLGIARMADTFRSFGLGDRVGIDIPGEAFGFIPSPEWKQEKKGERWYIGDTYHAAIGQGDILVTPLQVHAFTSYFANNGTSYAPFVVESTMNAVTGLRQTEPRVAHQNLIDAAHVKTIREGMRRAVTDGSARKLSYLPVTSAGKTGTAQWSSTKKPHAWYTGWAPFENPELAITVLVEEGEEGSRTALGVTNDILKWYFSPRAEPTKQPSVQP